MESILNFFLKSKQARRFYWTAFGGFLGLTIIYIESPEIAEYWFAPLLIALINGLTKEINNKL